jgi:hypothetical protein
VRLKDKLCVNQCTHTRRAARRMCKWVM